MTDIAGETTNTAEKRTNTAGETTNTTEKTTNIAENLKEIQDKIAAAAGRSGRDARDIQLICVSKTRSIAEVNEAVGLGVTDIGENKVQEIQEKFEWIKPVRWHMIGHLQTNKVKYIIDKVDLIHSVDSWHLASEINKRAAAAGKIMDILVQINVAEEDSKFGITVSETDGLIGRIAAELPSVRIKGLMTIAPFVQDPQEVRRFFRQIKEIFDRYASQKLPGTDFRYLSMGMSGDYEVAIEEGANMVRVGTAVFGARDYSKMTNR